MLLWCTAVVASLTLLLGGRPSGEPPAEPSARASRETPAAEPSPDADGVEPSTGASPERGAEPDADPGTPSTPMPGSEPEPGSTPESGSTPEPGSTPAPSEVPPPTSTPELEPPAESPADGEPAGTNDEDRWFSDEGVDDEPFPEQDDEALPDYNPLRDSPQALTARHWIRTGIVMMSTGGALLLGAVILGSTDPCNRAAGNSCQKAARNRAAVVMGLPGAVLLGGGGAALGVGIKRRRALALELGLSRRDLVIGVRGRF